MIRVLQRSFAAVVAVAALAISAEAAPPSGAAIYARHCAMCHDKSGETRAPARAVLGELTVERILAVMATGTMKPMAAAVSATDRRAVASFLSTKHGSSVAGPS